MPLTFTVVADFTYIICPDFQRKEHLGSDIPEDRDFIDSVFPPQDRRDALDSVPLFGELLIIPCG